MLLSLSGADASMTLHDYGLPLERAPSVIAGTVALIVADLRKKGSSLSGGGWRGVEGICFRAFRSRR